MFFSLLGASKIGVSEIVLIVIVLALIITLISIFCVTAAKKKKEMSKNIAAEEKKSEPIKESAPPEYEAVARTININKILGKSKEERDEYFNKILTAQTTSEVNKINDDKTLNDVVKPLESERLDEFVLFTEESLYDNNPAPGKIEVGKKYIDNK